MGLLNGEFGGDIANQIQLLRCRRQSVNLHVAHVLGLLRKVIEVLTHREFLDVEEGK